MLNTRDILEAITPSDRGIVSTTGSSGTGMGNVQNPIETYGALLSESQRTMLQDIAIRCLKSAEKSNGKWIQDVILCETPTNANYMVRKLQGYIKGFGIGGKFLLALAAL